MGPESQSLWEMAPHKARLRDSGPPRPCAGSRAGGRGAPHLVHADVALVTEDHLVAVLTLRGAAHVTDDVLVILDAKPLLSLDGPCHVLVAQSLQLLQHTLQRQLIQPGPLCREMAGDGVRAPPPLSCGGLSSWDFRDPEQTDGPNDRARGHAL